jgi:hypothetical protein
MAEQTGGIELFKLFGTVFLKGGEAVKGELDKLESKAKVVGEKFTKIGETMTKVGKIMMVGITAPLIAAGVASIKMASDLSETMNKIDVVFKDSAAGVKEWAKTSITAMGLAQQTALDSAALYGDMATSMGFVSSAAADMGEQLVQRAADLSSFKNIQIDIAKTALNGIFSGETESLKQLGVVMTIANLNEYAFNQGLKKTYDQMTQQEQVQLRFNYVMKTTANAAGDFARTQGGVANQTRMVQESLKELSAAFGTFLIPAAQKALQAVNKLLKGFIDLPESTKRVIMIFGMAVAAIGPLIYIIGKLNTVIGGIGPAIAKVITALGSQGLTGVIGTMIGPAGIIMLAIAAITLFVAWVISLGSESRAATNRVKELTDAGLESAKAFKEQTENARAEAATIKNLADKLFILADKENKSNAEKNDMIGLVAQLNKDMPELNLTIDEQTGLLNQNRTAVYELIKAKKDQIQLDAYQARLTELYKQQIIYSDELAKAQLRLATAQSRVDKWNGMVSYSLYSANFELKSAKKAVAILTSAIDDNAKSLGSAETAYDNFVDLVQSDNKDLTESTKDTSDMTGREMARYARYLKDAGKVSEQASDTMVNAAVRTNHLTYEEWQKTQEAIDTATGLIETSAQKYYDEMGNIVDGAVKAQKLSLPELEKNLREQIKMFAQWRRAIQLLAANPNITADMLAELEALGPAYTQLLIDLSDPKNAAELDKIIALFNEKFELGVDAAEKQLKRIPGIISVISGQSGTNLAIAVNTAAAQIAQFIIDSIQQQNTGGPGNPAPGYTAPTGGTSSNTQGPGAGYYFPQYAEGTNYVPETGLALLHKGEAVVPSDKVGGITINVNNAKLFNQNDARELANLIYSRWQLAGVGNAR